jgi:regulator of sirC expression with transglutaminase-like and TPR domain
MPWTAGATVLLSLAAVAWWSFAPEAPPAIADPPAPAAAPAVPAAPAPPARPRDAEVAGSDYERCMALAMIDPARALAEAQTWARDEGGDAAQHCAATALIQLGEPERAAELLERLGREALAPPHARAALLAQAGQLWLAAGRPDRAHAAATLGLAARPGDPELLTDRAIAAASQGRFDEAIEDLSRVVDLRPRQAEPLVLRASAWRQLGQPDLAGDDLARALALDPANPEALLERGLLRRDQGDLAAARADWEAAIRAAPRSAAAALAREHLARLDGGAAADGEVSPAAGRAP